MIAFWSSLLLFLLVYITTIRFSSICWEVKISPTSNGYFILLSTVSILLGQYIKEPITTLKKINIPKITISEFRQIHVLLIINEFAKRNLDMLGVFIMLSERIGHTIEVMQKVYMHLFPNIQSKVVDIMNDLDMQEQT